MEIETKIFDIKKVRKVLEKNKIEPHRVCDITDFLFDIEDFSPRKWSYNFPKGGKSAILSFDSLSVEVPDREALGLLEDFCTQRYVSRGSKIRLRLVDSVPYITMKGPKKTKKGVKSREEIETRIGSLSAMMQILLASGAVLEKSIARVREIYHLPDYPHAELIIDILRSAHGKLEYAEIECPSEDELHTLLDEVFDMDHTDISDTGVTTLHGKKMEKSVSRRLTALEELVGE
ncbi:CYTH domain-containing protein [Candidatus Gracilibacteria bacterium]|nr:CYTH domain-containing protein [Candidatus Gracilibacteria bacterium]